MNDTELGNVIANLCVVSINESVKCKNYGENCIEITEPETSKKGL